MSCEAGNIILPVLQMGDWGAEVLIRVFTFYNYGSIKGNGIAFKQSYSSHHQWEDEKKKKKAQRDLSKFNKVAEEPKS